MWHIKIYLNLQQTVSLHWQIYIVKSNSWLDKVIKVFKKKEKEREHITFTVLYELCGKQW